jgi:hypothetical protein
MTFIRPTLCHTACAVILFSMPAFAQSTEDVLNQHLKAFGEGDMEAILADYADNAVVMNEAKVMKGHEEIQPLFEAFFDEFGKPGVSFEMIDTKVEGDVAYIVWKAETPDNIYKYATDTFVIQDGKIVYQTLAGVVEAK